MPKKPRILVTGASGRLGTALQKLDGFEFLPLTGIDLSNYQNTAAVISGCGQLDGIVTLAGAWAPPEEQTNEDMLKANFITAFNTIGASIDSLANSKAPRIVLMGAEIAIGDDQSPYANAKRNVHILAEKLVENLPPHFRTNVIAPTTITDYDAVARKIVDYLSTSEDVPNGEVFVI